MDGVIIKTLSAHTDSRGHLIELFRSDELPETIFPAMGYISVTHPGVSRGPHEHEDQTDIFVFLNGSYHLYLWENRPGKPDAKEILTVGADEPTLVVVPPGVVHAYKNVGPEEAYVLNFPNRLYAGKGKNEPVDEIRHENDPKSRFHL